jgi:hypothetical protein
MIIQIVGCDTCGFVVSARKTTRGHNPEDHNLNSHRREKVKTYVLNFSIEERELLLFNF